MDNNSNILQYNSDIQKIKEKLDGIIEINEKLGELLVYHKDKLDNTVLRLQIGDIATKLDISNKKLHDTQSILTSSQHFLELIAEYATLAKDGTIDEYRGHLVHLRNLAETALNNIEKLGQDDDRQPPVIP